MNQETASGPAERPVQPRASLRVRAIVCVRRVCDDTFGAILLCALALAVGEVSYAWYTGDFSINGTRGGEITTPAGRAALLAVIILLLVAFAAVVRAMWTARRVGDLFAEQRLLLREREESYALVETLFSSTPIGLGYLDRALRFVRVNDALAEINGLPSDAHLGRPIDEVLPVFALTLLPLLHDVLQTGQSTSGVELTGETPAAPGETRHWLAGYYPVCTDDDEVLGIGMVVADITERRRGEANQRFRAEISTVLAGSLDVQATLTSVAQLALPELGDWCAVDALGDDGLVHRLAVAHVDPARAHLVSEVAARFPIRGGDDRAVARVLRSGEAELIHMDAGAALADLHAPDGLPYLLDQIGSANVAVVPVLARGRPLGTITLGRGPGGRRYGPAQLDLLEALARRAAVAWENARHYREAREALRTRDEFLASVSHDLKTPLTTIRGQAQRLKRRIARVGSVDAERVEESVAGIEDATKKMNALIDQLLDVSRMQTGRPLDLDLQPMDLVALVRRVVAELQPTTERHTLAVQTATPQLHGVWDEGRVERVIANILSNAIKYSLAGGEIIVTVAKERLVDGQFRALVRVSDPGIGIPESDLPRISERFYRASNVAGRTEGTGIGLAGSRQIVEQHGGTLEIESEEGRGTRVTVRLPLATSQPRADIAAGIKQPEPEPALERTSPPSAASEGSPADGATASARTADR